MTTFKVGDRVRSVIGYRNGQVGTVTLATGFSCNVLLDARADQGPLNFHDSELELVKPEPAFAVGDRVELAGVTGTVTSHGSTCIVVKWDDGNLATFDNAGDILKQLKKLPEERVFVTGAWYKSSSLALNKSLFRLTPSGWQQVIVNDTRITVFGPDDCGDVANRTDLTEVDFPL